MIKLKVLINEGLFTTYKDKKLGIEVIKLLQNSKEPVVWGRSQLYSTTINGTEITSSREQVWYGNHKRLDVSNKVEKVVLGLLKNLWKKNNVDVRTYNLKYKKK